MRYMLVIDGEPTGRMAEFEEGQAPVLAGKPGMRWLPFPEGKAPEYDPATQQVETELVLQGGQVLLMHEVVDLKQEQVNERAVSEIRATDTKLVRLIEDLVEHLGIEGKLPEQVQGLLKARREARARVK